MERSGEELTRLMLLNSNSRGSLEEVAGDEDAVTMSGLSGDGTGTGLLGETDQEEPFYAKWEGRDLTRKMYLQSYD